MTRHAPNSPAAPRAPRLNADYRWTLPKALAFLEALARCGKVAEAARAVGMSRQSAFRLRKRLGGGPLAAGWEAALNAGIAARRNRRPRSRWEGPGLGAAAFSGQGDGSAPQGDGFRAR